MDLTEPLLNFLRGSYLNYREFEAAQAGLSAQMRARVNALEGKLFARPTLTAADLTPSQYGPSPEHTILTRKLLTYKPAMYGWKAEHELGRFLGNNLPAGSDSKARNLKDELDLLAGYILSLRIGGGEVKWIPGPLKKIEKAMSKTIADYDYAWTENKDLVRGTLVSKTAGGLVALATLMKNTCVSKYGMHLIKQVEQASERDGGEAKLAGWSGWNFVIQFKEHTAFGAEVQANTLDMLYGKHSKKELVEDYRAASSAEYSEVQHRMNFPGALGHALYDIQDVARSGATKEEGDWARELALDYNDACRGKYRGKRKTVLELNQAIHEAGSHWTSAKAQELWKHAVKESGWTGFPLQIL